MTVVLRWKAPTRNNDGSLIKGRLTYDIFSFGASDEPDPLAVDVEGTYYTVEGLTGRGEQCFYVKAVVNGARSPGSNIACIRTGDHA